MKLVGFQKTKKLGKQIAAKISLGDILCLKGELGSGKTVFVKGLAAGLGIKDVVNSPTFNIMKLYSIGSGKKKFTLYHVDCYRIKNSQELLDIGFNEWIGDKKGVVAIEWADKIKNILPSEVVEIDFKVTGEKEREVIVKGI